MPDHYYRLRPIESLLGVYKELETQTIYFASPEELNDPMEGFKDLFWLGDEILWTNLFKHYLRCVSVTFTLILLLGKEPVTWTDIPVEEPSHANGPGADELDEKIFAAFFAQPSVAEFVKGLAHSGHPIRRDELSSYIRLMHPFASLVTQKVFAENMGGPPLDAPPEVWTAVIDALGNLPLALREMAKAEKDIGSSPESVDVRATIFAIGRNTARQMDLIHQYNRRETPDARDTPNKTFFYFQFPDGYVDQLSRLTYSKWHAACFMSDIGNSSLWGSYGVGHKGVALKFKARPGAGHPTLGLHGVNGWSHQGPIRGLIQHEFLPVTYGTSHVPIDFFASLGNMSIGKLNRYWYQDASGARSARPEKFFADQPAWRKQYWENYTKIISTKLDDWKHENEHRLIFSSSLVDQANSKAERALKYNFEDLAGIVFGIKTSEEHKMAIMKIIETKCRAENRFDFLFYQSYFSPDTGAITHSPLPFLKFK